MCRMLALRSVNPETLDHLLLDSPRCLSLLSHEHKHGWGMAQYFGSSPVIERSALPAWEDPEFEQAARILEGTCLLAHIRKASVGTVHVANPHPFQHGRWLFCHNGTIRGFAASREALDEHIAPHLLASLHGDTDSERCFGLFLTFLERFGALSQPPVEVVACALAETIAVVHSVVHEPPTGLCFLATDGDRLVGVRSGERELCYSFDEGRRLLIASEPLAPEIDWTIMDDGDVVATDASLKLRKWKLAGTALRWA
jgi:glutamine amidotransferase